LRGLPARYQYLVSNIKVRERLPEVEEVINLVFLETQADITGSVVGTYVAERTRCGHKNHEPSKCWILHPEITPVCYNCGRRGHVKKDCPDKKRDAVKNEHAAAAAERVGYDPFSERFDGMQPLTL
jgi:hypothetical protein